MNTSILPTYNRAPLAFERGEGSWLFTNNGDGYLDMGAGIAVNALGHSNSELVDALTSQANKLWHVSNLYEIPEQQRLAELMVDTTFADNVFFTNWSRKNDGELLSTSFCAELRCASFRCSMFPIIYARLWALGPGQGPGPWAQAWFS